MTTTPNEPQGQQTLEDAVHGHLQGVTSTHDILIDALTRREASQAQAGYSEEQLRHWLCAVEGAHPHRQAIVSILSTLATQRESIESWIRAAAASENAHRTARKRIAALETEKLNDAARGEEIISAREKRIAALEADKQTLLDVRAENRKRISTLGDWKNTADAQAAKIERMQSAYREQGEKSDSLREQLAEQRATNDERQIEIDRLRIAGPVGMTREKIIDTYTEWLGTSLPVDYFENHPDETWNQAARGQLADMILVSCRLES